MAIDFTTTEQATEAGGIKMLVYGNAGIGKTMLCATLPNPIVISAESGLLSLRKVNIERAFGVNTQGITYNLNVAIIKDIDDLFQMYNWCIQNPTAYESVALDSISEMAEQVLNKAKRTCKDPRQAYGELIERMETVVRMFRDLPNKHVYMAAKMEYNKDELTGISSYGPSMPGAKLGQKMPYFFDEVFYFGINKDQEGKDFRFLQTQPDLQHQAKDRSGALAPMEFPHLGYLINKMVGA